jgi:hypothetical protein
MFLYWCNKSIKNKKYFYTPHEASYNTNKNENIENHYREPSSLLLINNEKEKENIINKLNLLDDKVNSILSITKTTDSMCLLIYICLLFIIVHNLYYGWKNDKGLEDIKEIKKQIYLLRNKIRD